MKDRKDMSRGTRDYDKGYAKGMKVGSGVMKNHGNTQSIPTTSPEKFDLGKVDWLPMERRGYCMEAYDYKY